MEIKKFLQNMKLLSIKNNVKVMQNKCASEMHRRFKICGRPGYDYYEGQVDAYKHVIDLIDKMI